MTTVSIEYEELSDLLDDVVTTLKEEREHWGDEAEDLTAMIDRVEAYWEKVINLRFPAAA